MSSVPLRRRALSVSPATLGNASPGRGPWWMKSTAWWRLATSSSGRIASASLRVRKALPGICAPIMPGSPSARSSSAAAAEMSASGSAAKAAKRPGCSWQIAESRSLMRRHSGPDTSSGWASTQQNEPRSDSTLTSTPWRSIRPRWNSTSSKASASDSSPIRDFSTSTPSPLLTMRGSRVRARRASATSAGRQWACMSIMAVFFMAVFLHGSSGSLTPRRLAAKHDNCQTDRWRQPTMALGQEAAIRFDVVDG